MANWVNRHIFEQDDFEWLVWPKICFASTRVLSVPPDRFLAGWFFEVVLSKQLFLSASAGAFRCHADVGQVGYERLLWVKSSLLLFAYFVVSTVSRVQTPH